MFYAIMHTFSNNTWFIKIEEENRNGKGERFFFGGGG